MNSSIPIIKKQDGFTLLELIIGMALTSVLCVILFSSYTMLLSYRQDAQNHLQIQEEKRLQKIIIDNDFANLSEIFTQKLPFSSVEFASFALPTKLNKSEFIQNPHEEFVPQKKEGEEILLAFTTNHHLFEASDIFYSPLRYVEYVLIEARNGHHLFRRERNFANITYFNEKKEMLLFKNIQAITIDFIIKEQKNTIAKTRSLQEVEALQKNGQTFLKDALKAVELEISYTDKHDTDNFFVQVLGG